MQLSAIDTNLLVMLHPLLQTRSVNQAATTLGLSASATSHALARLRALFDDELLVRAGRRMVLTQRGKELAPLVAQAVASLQQVLLPPEGFRPQELERSFHIAYGESWDWVLLPALDAALREQAPLVDLHTHHASTNIIERLRGGTLDCAFFVGDPLPPDMHARTLMHDRFVSIVRVGHPCLDRRMTLKRFATLEHILVAPRGTPGGVVEALLANKGLKRRVRRTFSSFMSAPFLVAQTDYVLTLPASASRVAATLVDFEILDMPAAAPGYAVRLGWHERMHQDPAHRWLRELIVDQAKPYCCRHDDGRKT